MPSPQPHLLKVFSGPHVGAEVLLADGEHVLGSGDDCDVILNDQFIAEKHVRIKVARDKVTCAAIGDAKVFIDGAEVAESVLEPFQYFTVGNTHLAIGPPDVAWPHRDFPGFQLNAPAAEEPETVKEEEAADSEQVAETTRTPATNSPVPTVQNDAPAGSRLRRRWIVLAVSAAMLLALFSTVFELAARSSGQADTIKPLTVAEVEAVVNADADAAKSSVTVSEKNGWIEVNGFVPDGDARQRLNDALLDLEDANPTADVSINLTDMQNLADSAQGVLDLYARKWPELAALHATPGKPGQVVIAGQISNHEEWDRARDAIRDDVPRIQELDDSQIAWPGHVPVVRPAAAPTSTPTRVDPPSTIPSNDVADTVGEQPEREDPAEPATESDGPQLDIVRVVSRALRPQLTLSSGTVVYVGGRVPGGYVVESIEPDQIILSRDGVQHSISLGDLR